jgi:hypothetical protein
LLVAVAAFTTPAVASAQPTAAERAASSQSDYRRAHEAARNHDWLEARRILLGLWKKAKTYDVAASLSEAEYALGHVAASARYMDYALRHVTPNESAATVANMKSALEKLRPKVGAVRIVVDQPGASVRVDGASLEYEPQTEVFVEPGQHFFEARSGHRESSQTIDVAAGSSQVLKLELAETTPAPEAASVVSTAPMPEAHRGDSHARTVALFVGGALAVGGLGTGIGFGISSNSSEHDVADYRARVGTGGCQSASMSEDCSALQAAVDSQRRKTHIANLGYGVAAAGLVTVGVALLWPRATHARTARASQVELRWSGDAVFLGGSF